MTAPFDYLNSIMTNKTYLITDDQTEKEYPAFFINRGLSQHVDCLMAANVMNQNSHLDHKLQFDYLFHTIRKIKRKYGPWAKRTNNDEIKAISGYYGVNYRRAREYLSVLSPSQLDVIIKTMETVKE